MSVDQDKLVAKLEELANQFDAIESQLADPQIMSNHQRVRELSIRRSALDDLVSRYRRWRSLQSQIEEHNQIISDAADADLVQLATEELPALREEGEGLLDAIAAELVTADDRAVGSVILEVRAGTGGAEAALWAGDIFEMYQRFAALRKLSFDVLQFSQGDQGGVRHAVAAVAGPGVWQALGYEGGVHCVKRVPATETQGRIHTSTATVAVLPEPETVQIDIPESDVTMHITTAQGPGGQNVNKVATAVHMIHNPTGIEVRMQESKSQAQNRQKAWQLLRARVYDHYQQEKDAERSEQRATMIGAAKRSERIRTYRYKENIAVDHRLGESFPLQKLLSGDLDDLITGLLTQDKAERLAAL